MRAFPALTTCTVLVALASALPAPPQEPVLEPRPGWESFEIDTLRAEHAKRGRAYLPFLERSTLRCGLYVLPAGATDGQSPHSEDEVYQVLRGRARFTCARDGEEETLEVRPGQVLFVAAGVEHRFHDIEEELELLVFFSRAEPDGR